MKTVLVTGVAGFIGSKVADELINQGYRVVGVDNLSTGRIEVVPSGVIFIEKDTFSLDLIDEISRYEIEAIFHIAGQSSAEVSYKNPVYDMKSNVESTLLLLNFCVEKNIQHFIFASSATVYGEQESPLLLTEDIRPEPVSFYAIGKLASERYLKLYSKEYGITTTALRLFNVYGPGQNLENLDQGMVSIFLAQALRNKRVLVKGDSNRFRDFVFIDDVVKIFVETLGLKKGSNNIFNVCTGVKTTVLEVIDNIKLNIGENLPVEYKGATRGDIKGQTGSNEKMINYFEIGKLTSFNEGMEKMVLWAKDYYKHER